MASTWWGPPVKMVFYHQTFKPQALTVKDLSDHADRSNKAILHSTKSSGSPLVDAELWAKTVEEQQKGWLEELPSPPKDGGRISRRFAVSNRKRSDPQTTTAMHRPTLWFRAWACRSVSASVLGSQTVWATCSASLCDLGEGLGKKRQRSGSISFRLYAIS